MIFPEYVKINSIWKRDTKGKVIEGDFATPELEYLSNLPWTWSEQIDGMNIRIGWDGREMLVGGRTDRAQLPTKLYDAISHLLSDRNLISAFPDASPESPVVLYGEGYGAGIQKGGGNYRSDQSFILFDVLIGGFWLSRGGVHDVTIKLDLAHVNEILPSYFTMIDAHNFVKMGDIKSDWYEQTPEGVVGRPIVDLFDRKGNRIMVKIKGKDYA